MPMYQPPSRPVQGVNAQAALTGNTNKRTEASYAFGPIGLNGRIKVRFHGTNNNSAGTKAYRVEINGTPVITAANTTATNMVAEFEIIAMNSNTVQEAVGSAPRGTDQLRQTVGPNATAFDLSAGGTVSITAQLNTGTDNMKVSAYSFEVVKG